VMPAFGDGTTKGAHPRRTQWPRGEGIPMGAIAEAFREYAQPLLDATDGSAEQAQRALTLAQVCWNLALEPAKDRDETLSRLSPVLEMGEEEFRKFHAGVLVPMILRHQEMFPDMHGGHMRPPASEVDLPTRIRTKEGHQVGRNAPCPCDSGKKYKQCCGK